ncbi:MAG: hypothetical protein E7220_04570 [Clostridiales bacterium]|nr:hypothetical protein [Clostridiales bacterium]
MKKIRRMSKRTTAIIVAAVLLLMAGSATGARAALNIISDYAEADFYLNHLQVHLVENGKDVCGGANDLSGEDKITGRLATSLGYENDESVEGLGTVDPGKVYKEEIAAENGQDIDQFVRMTVRKYWVETEKTEDGKYELKKDRNGNPVKTTALKPSLIHLMYGGKEGYNTGSWTENESERTTESSTYYYNTELGPNDTSDLLFDQIMIDNSVAELGKKTETKEGNKTIFNYEYKYDGYVFFIEADVQAIQTHNINDAIHSQWGVYDVSGTYTDGSGGSLSVN